MSLLTVCVERFFTAWVSFSSFDLQSINFNTGKHAAQVLFLVKFDKFGPILIIISQLIELGKYLPQNGNSIIWLLLLSAIKWQMC